MFSFSYLAGSFSLCLRCQLRLAKHRQRLFRVQPLKQNHGQSRYLCHSQNLAGREVQREKDDFDYDPIQPKVPQDAAIPHFPYVRLKQFDIYTKDDLGTDSLGEPAEALVLRAAEEDQDATFYTRHPDKRNGADAPSSTDEILNRFKAEIGIASASGVAKNLLDLKDAWAARRNSKTRSPTAQEFGDLVQRIRSGFSTKQLYGYYSEMPKPAPDPYNIDLPYSSKAYTRSTWTVGSTPFPGNARSSRRSVKSSAEALVSAEPWTSGTRGKPLHLPKGVLIERILRDCWGIRDGQDEEAPGELEIWFPYEHVCLLMDHSQDILRRLSERYGVKIDASRSLRLLRITGDRGTCADVFKFLWYAVQRIETAEIELKPSQEPIGGKLNRAGPRSTTVWEELSQLTNTIITPIPGKESSSKVVVYYLGPSKDDLTDARRLLLQSEHSPKNRSVRVHWGGRSHNERVAANLVEVGTRLPFAERGQEWSRWALPVERNEPAVAHGVRRKAVEMALKSQNIQHNLQTDVSHEELRCWPKMTQQSCSVTVGHVLYPTKFAKHLKFTGVAKCGEKVFARFTKRFQLPHQFLGINLGFRSFPLGNDIGKLAWKDELRIYLIPMTCEAQSEQPTVPLPELEIRLAIDQVQRTTKLGSVRLIFEKREADLLMPSHPTDLRFCTEMYAAANNLNDLPQELSHFLASSNLNIWGTDRLKTPPGLRFPIPQYSKSDVSPTPTAKSQAARPTLDPASLNYVDYTFASLEHRSELVELSRGHNLVYSVIEAGRTGGRREELSVVGQKTGSENPGMSLYEVAQKIIKDSHNDGTSQNPSADDSRADPGPLKKPSAA